MDPINLDRLTGLIAFARAASLGSYAAAARSLSVSPSAISKSIQRLEGRLGLRLFNRTTRSLVLTAEGRDLHVRAQRLLREAEDIEQVALAARAEPSGTIKITAPLPIGVHILAPALTRFRQLYPKLAVDMRLSDRLVDLFEEGIDVAIRVSKLEDSRLIARHLAPHRVCAFASPGYLAARGTPRTPQDLMEHDCVNFRYQSSGQMLRWPFLVGSEFLELVPESGISIDVSDAVTAVIAAGGGIGICTTYAAAPFIRRGEIVPVLAECAVNLSHITALWQASRRSSPNVKAFVAFLADLFPSPTPWDSLIQKAPSKGRATRR